jgi:hypothetical protein
MNANFGATDEREGFEIRSSRLLHSSLIEEETQKDFHGKMLRLQLSV